MDIVDYTSDRFPIAFAAFLREQFQKRTIAPTELYVHNQAVEAAYGFIDETDLAPSIFYKRGAVNSIAISLCSHVEPPRLSGRFQQRSGPRPEADVFPKFLVPALFPVSIGYRPILDSCLFSIQGERFATQRSGFVIFRLQRKMDRVLLEQGWQLHPIVKEGLDMVSLRTQQSSGDWWLRGTSMAAMPKSFWIRSIKRAFVRLSI